MKPIHKYIASFILLISLCFYGAGYIVSHRSYVCPEQIASIESLNSPQIIIHNKKVIKAKVKNVTCSYRKISGDNYNLVQESQVSYTEPKKIAILYISTGKYITFWDDFYRTMEEFFLPRHKKTYFLFTDSMDLSVPENVVKIETKQEKWPYITLKRYHFFTSISDRLKDFDYIYFLNGNLIPKVEIDEEIFPTDEQGIMVTLHPGFFWNTPNLLTYERNLKSQSYIPYNEGKYYVAGAFNGGTAPAFLSLSAKIKEMTDIDLKNNVMPVWHDESMLNRYLLDYMETRKPLVLLPEYLIPEGGGIEGIPQIKMLLLDKSKRGGHGWLRSVENK